MRTTSAKLALLAILLLPVQDAEPSVEELQRALGVLTDAYRNNEPVNRRNLGGIIHRAVDDAWANMADMPESGITRGRQFLGHRGSKPVYHFGPQIDVTVYDERREEFVTERRPRYEVWIEKTIVPGSATQADQVFIDHQERRIFVNDITSRSIDDPVIQSASVRSRQYQETVGHEAATYNRAALIMERFEELGDEAERRNQPRIPRYDVEVGTPSAQYYQTHIEADVRAGRGRGRQERMRAINRTGNSANTAARGTIGAIFIGIGISMMFPEAARAESSMNSSAAKDFEQMLRHYVRGEHTQADAILRYWRHADATIYAKNLFPNMSDGVALAFAESFLIPYLEELRERTRHVYQRRVACRRAEAEARSAAMREAEARLGDARGRVLRQLDNTFDSLLSRAGQWRLRLSDIARRRGEEPITAASDGPNSWRALESFVENSGQFLRELRTRHQQLRQAANTVDAGGLQALSEQMLATIGQSYGEYWVFMTASTYWAQLDAGEHQQAEKANLRREYRSEVRSLQASGTPTDAPDWEQLRSSYVDREELIDSSARRNLAELYRAFARETSSISMELSQLGGDFIQAARDMSDTSAGGRLSQIIDERMFVELDALVYEYVDPSLQRYTEALRVESRPIVEQVLGQDSATSAEGRIALLAVWIDGEQARLADLGRPLSAGAELRFWAAVIQDDHPGEHDWPIGPPPAGGIPSREFLWTFQGAEPQRGGHLFSVTMPEVSGADARNVQLRIVHPAAGDLVRNLTVRSNRGPQGCLSVPENAHVEQAVRLSWRITDEDELDPLTLTIETDGAIVGESAFAAGAGSVSRNAATIEVQGKQVLSGDSTLRFTEPGRKTITAVFSDGSESVEQSYSIDVAGNEAPSLRTIGVSNSNPAVGEPFIFSYAGNDPDASDEVRFYITKPKSMRIQNMEHCRTTSDGSGCSATLVGTEDGRFELTAIISDNWGLEDSQTLEVVVGNPGIDCSAINCDCSNVEFGLLTGPYRQECRNREAGLRAACEAAEGPFNGSCDSVTSGPNAYPQ